MGVIILGASTLYINFCLLKEIPMASKGLIAQANILTSYVVILSWESLHVPCLHVVEKASWDTGIAVAVPQHHRIQRQLHSERGGKWGENLQQDYLYERQKNFATAIYHTVC